MAIIISSTWKHIRRVASRNPGASGTDVRMPSASGIMVWGAVSSPHQTWAAIIGGVMELTYWDGIVCVCVCKQWVLSPTIPGHWQSCTPNHTAKSVGESCEKDYYCLGHWQLAWGGKGTQLDGTILFVFVLLSLSWSGHWLSSPHHKWAAIIVKLMEFTYWASFVFPTRCCYCCCIESRCSELHNVYSALSSGDLVSGGFITSRNKLQPSRRHKILKIVIIIIIIVTKIPIMN